MIEGGWGVVGGIVEWMKGPIFYGGRMGGGVILRKEVKGEGEHGYLRQTIWN